MVELIFECKPISFQFYLNYFSCRMDIDCQQSMYSALEYNGGNTEQNDKNYSE